MASHGVWDHFDKIPDEDDTANCKYCNAQVSCRQKNTKNMWKHVKKCHPEEISEMPLEKPGRLDVCDKSKSHLRELCEMCRSLGYNCLKQRRKKKGKK